jgi:hypothetical protein
MTDVGCAIRGASSQVRPGSISGFDTTVTRRDEAEIQTELHWRSGKHVRGWFPYANSLPCNSPQIAKLDNQGKPSQL